MARRSFKPYKLISAATTNATSVKAGPAVVSGYDIGNTNVSVLRFVKLYNMTGAPTVGTDVPVMDIAVPPGGKAALALSDYALFPVGLALAITAGPLDTDTTAVGAAEVVVNLFFT